MAGRSASLRTRVAIAATLAAAIVVAMLTVLTSVVLANNDAAQLDRRLDSIVDASMYPEQLQDVKRGVLTTGRSRSTGQVVFQRGLPAAAAATRNRDRRGQRHRLPGPHRARRPGGRNPGVDRHPGRQHSAEPSPDSALRARSASLSVLVAAGLGWMLAGPAIRPLRRLTEQTRRLGKGAERMEPVHGAREAEDLSEAMDRDAAPPRRCPAATTNSLQAAQDFAANAAHELRTPLTAMRADLDTLRIHDLPDDERAEVVADLSRAQRRVEAIITALGQLASGQLARAEDREADRRHRDARPGGPGEPAARRRCRDHRGRRRRRNGVGLAGRSAAGRGQPGAQRHHSRWCHPIVLTARREEPHLVITVDDNGRGLPVEEHEAVLGRFARGSTAAPGGSGLGLALVAQQAALHGGRIELSDGPLGGLRATLTVSTSLERSPPRPTRTSRCAWRPVRRRPASRAAEAPSPARPPR